MCLAMLVTLGVAGHCQEGPFRKGDKICFVGNSITFNGGFLHEIRAFYATRYPGQRLTILNQGIGGNVAAAVLARMDSDIVVHHPDWCILKLGMNDVQRELYGKAAENIPGVVQKRKAALDLFRKNYEQIIRIFLQHQIKVILQTPTVYDETAVMANEPFTGRNGALRQCAEYVKAFGKKYHLPVVDYWSVLDSITHRVQAVDSTATIIGPDRVHPGPVGHFIMAATFLKEMKMQRAVSVVELRAGSVDMRQVGEGQVGRRRVGEGQVGRRQVGVKSDEGSVVRAEHAVVSDVHMGRQGGSWKCLEASLPFPVGRDAEPALGLIPFQQDLNEESLQVRGLEAGHYVLTIDGVEAGRFSSVELGQGIGLSRNASTPQYQQSRQVLRLLQNYYALEGKVRWTEALAVGRVGASKLRDPGAMERYFDQAIQALNDTSAAYKNMRAMKEQYMEEVRKVPASGRRMEEIMDSVYLINKPVVHRYELVSESSSLLFEPGATDVSVVMSSFNDARAFRIRNGLPELFKKVQAGKPLVIAYIGGSVTQMDNKYRNQSARWIRDLWPNNKIQFINAGVAGTGMDLGACRIGEQVLRFKPDLIFIEFAVNGAYLPGLEGMIRKIRRHDPSTGICILNGIFSGQSQFYIRGEIPANIRGMDSVAEYYGLPSIHMGLEPSLLEAQGKLVFKGTSVKKGDTMVFSDGIHPTEWGGYIYAGAIVRGLRLMGGGGIMGGGVKEVGSAEGVKGEVKEKENIDGVKSGSKEVESAGEMKGGSKDTNNMVGTNGELKGVESKRGMKVGSKVKENMMGIKGGLKGKEIGDRVKNDSLPTALFFDNWEDAQMLSPDQVQFSEGWVRMDLATDSNLAKFKPWFPYVMKSGQAGATCSFDFRGTRIGLFDIGGPEVGQLEVRVDGKSLKPLNRFNHWCNNRYRGQYDLVELAPGQHHVEFIVSKEVPDKKAILGNGQSADIVAHPGKYDHSVIYLGKILIKGTMGIHSF
jgi:lysophospholipase L1-like esterase